MQPPRVAPQNTPSSLSAGLRRGQECPRPQLTLFPLPAPEAPALKPILAIEDDIPFLSPALIRLTRWIADYYCAPFEATLRCVMPSSVRDRTTRAKEQLYVYLAEKPPADATLTKRQRELLAELTRLGGGWLAAMLKELACSPETLRTLAAAGAIRIEPRQMRRDPLANRKILPTKPLPLMPEQATALAAVEAAIEAYRVPGDSPARRPILLHGVTGSGKTEVYLQAIARVLADGLDAIVLVPEIALTPQTVQRFAARFGNLIAVLHSALSDGERFDEWHRIRSGEARVVVGPRSAVFAPVHHLGIIIVDEEHEPSYKQDEVPHYSARDVAIMRGIFESCPVVLGTATPSLETWLNVKRGKYAIVRLASRVANRPMPDVRLVDMRLEKDESGRVPLFSRLLLDAIKSRLERGEQVMLFRNRRGYATSLVCPDCGATPTCEFCDLPMTYHEADHCLRCHVCGRWQHVPEKCPSCGSPNLLRRGNGTQRIEDALHKCFPSARILRLDLDITTRKSSHDEVLGEFRSREADILIGTQMIAKGLDFPNVTLVGVLSADSGLNLPDFRAAERTYQLLAQVSGRAGRADLPGEVYIQTFLPDHPAIRAALSETCFPDFADAELAEREHGLYPPYTHAVCLTFRGKQESRVSYYSGLYEKELKAWAAASREVRILVSDSCPAPLPKANGSYRYQILLRAKTAHPLTQLVRSALAVHPLPNDVLLAVDVDAINVM